ncbi:hypothetical protein GCM10009101_10780 [Brevundimonas lenta]
MLKGRIAVLSTPAPSAAAPSGAIGTVPSMVFLQVFQGQPGSAGWSGRMGDRLKPWTRFYRHVQPAGLNGWGVLEGLCR